jgi:ureidoglycolate lyase
MRTITPKSLCAKKFAKFGDVIEVNDSVQHYAINDGYCERYHDLAELQLSKANGRALINIFRATPLTLPILINKMERHPLSSQCFVPMGQEPYLVVVAPAGEFDEAAIEVFVATSNQGVNYHIGTWHHFCLALNDVSDFLVIDRGGEGDNCDEQKLKQKLRIGRVKC